MWIGWKVPLERIADISWSFIDCSIQAEYLANKFGDLQYFYALKHKLNIIYLF